MPYKIKESFDGYVTSFRIVKTDDEVGGRGVFSSFTKAKTEATRRLRNIRNSLTWNSIRIREMRKKDVEHE